MSYDRKGEGFSKLGMSEFDFFLRLIPYNLYVLFTLLFIVVLLIFQRDFGPMLRAEQRAISGEGLYDEERYGKSVCDDSMEKNTGAKPVDMIFPLLVLVSTAVLSFPLTTYYSELKAGKVKSISEAFKSMSVMDAFRNTDVSCALFYSIVVTLAVVILWCIRRKLLKTNEISESIIDGVRSMIPALVILVLAWTIGGVIRSAPADGGVGLASFLSQIVKNGSFPFALLPFLVFCCSCLIAFSTGTSWGCMAIMIPVTMPLAMAAADGLAADAQLGAVLFVMSAAIGGAIFGDHASPISDTTILSSTGAGCPCLEHVATQMPYASFIALCSGAGYLVGGWSLNLGAAAATTMVLFIAGVIILPKISSAK
jgi:Na+/H+ antiporter NhaC